MQTWMPPPKPDVLRGVLPADVELVGPLEDARIAVRRSEQQRDLRAARDRHVADRKVVRQHPALEELERRIEPDQLFARRLRRDTSPSTTRRHCSGLRAKASMPFPSVLTVASCPALSRTMTVLTISSSDRRAAVDSRLDERGDHVVARFRAPFADQLADVLLKLGRGIVRRRCAASSGTSNSYIFTMRCDQSSRSR